MDEFNKKHIYNILFENSIKYIYNLLKSDIKNDIKKFNNISKILFLISNIRYDIEFLLSKLFPNLDLDINLSKFGRSRSKTGNHGRKYLFNKIKKYYYIPFEFLIDDDYYEVLLTPIFIKYKNYDDKIKKHCLDNDKYIKSPNSYCYQYDTNIYDKKNIKDLNKLEPAFHLLHKYENIGFSTVYKNIELTSFYYELNDKLYNELNNIPINNRFLSNDINMYRAIYHTNPKYHVDILDIINKKYIQIINNNDLNITFDEKMNLIKEIYWFLSHATLYDRGSCAITEILCNVLMIFINDKEHDKEQDKDKIFINKKNINTDIEAMITTSTNIFINTFNDFVNYKNIDNIDNFADMSSLTLILNNNINFDGLIINSSLNTIDINTLFNLLNKKIKLNEQKSNIINLIDEFNF